MYLKAPKSLSGNPAIDVQTSQNILTKHCLQTRRNVETPVSAGPDSFYRINLAQLDRDAGNWSTSQVAQSLVGSSLGLNYVFNI